MPLNWNDILGYGATGAAYGSRFGGGQGALIGAGIGGLAGLLKGYLSPSQNINYQPITDQYRRILENQYAKAYNLREKALKREYQRRGLSSSPALMAGLSRLKAEQARQIAGGLDKLALARMQAMEQDERARLARQQAQNQQLWTQTIPTAALQTIYNLNPPQASSGLTSNTVTPETENLLKWAYMRGTPKQKAGLEQIFPELFGPQSTSTNPFSLIGLAPEYLSQYTGQ